MKGLLLAAILALPAHGDDTQTPPAPEPPQTMPAPTPPKEKAPRKPKKKGRIRKKVEEYVPPTVQKGIEKSVSVATTTVAVPFSFLRDTLFLVRTEFDGKLLLHFPSLDADPNRGVTYGLMPVLLVPETRKDGTTGTRIQTIFAPSVTYNQVFGWTGTVRLVHFHDAWQQVSFEGSLSERTNRKFVANYSNDRLPGGRRLALRAADERDGSNRFYGVGMGSKESDEANYTREVIGYRVSFSQPVAKHCSVGAHHRLETLRVAGAGPLKGVPDLDVKYPGLAQKDALSLAWYRFYTDYDTRDSRGTPTKGRYLSLFWEVSPKTFFSSRNLTAWGGDLRAYFPHGAKGQDFVFTPRVRWQSVRGTQIPFFALSRLGGKESLRAYGEGRFVDRSMLTAGAEERWTGFRFKILDTPIEFETGPFAEAGQVFPTASQLSVHRARGAAGFFIRGVARPQLVGSLDVGWGREGAALFLDVDYSW